MGGFECFHCIYMSSTQNHLISTHFISFMQVIKGVMFKWFKVWKNAWKMSGFF